MLVTHMLNKDNNIICFVSDYLSIQFSIDADICHFIVKEQHVYVL